MISYKQENYLANKPLPHGDLKSVDTLENVCKAAEFISDGDLVDRVIRCVEIYIYIFFLLLFI